MLAFIFRSAFAFPRRIAFAARCTVLAGDLLLAAADARLLKWRCRTMFSHADYCYLKYC